MSGLFEFLTVFNLIVILICVIGLYYSINLVIYYYAPTSTGFVNMYFLYYIFFITTLLVAVGCNNYIEMNGGSVVAPAAVVTNLVNAEEVRSGSTVVAPEQVLISPPPTLTTIPDVDRMSDGPSQNGLKMEQIRR